MICARYFDGMHAVSTEVRLLLYPNCLSITGEHIQETWMFADMHPVTNPADGLPMRLGHAKNPAARLEVSDAETWETLRLRLKEHGRLGFHISFKLPLLLCMGGLALIMMLAAHRNSPQLARMAAPYLPQSIRQHASEMAMKMFGAPEKLCSWKEDIVQIARLEAQLTEAADIDRTVTITLIRDDVPNAFALPNGNIVLTSGLLKTMKSPEMLIGVLAHEMGHVVRDHAGEGLAEGMGMQALFLLMTGQGSDVIDSRTIAQFLWSSSHQRDKELEADRIAMDILRQAQIAPEGFIAFFETQQVKEADPGTGVLSYISTHPSNALRIAALKRLATEGEWRTKPPSLTTSGLDSLRKHCHKE